MADYAFFALWFLLAHGLAPADAAVLTLENEQRPEQRMQWVRADDGAWAMTINGRELGRFRRSAEGVVHETGQRAPDTYAVADLLESADLQPNAPGIRLEHRIRLRGRFAPTVLRAEHDGLTVHIRDPSRQLTPVTLRLQSSIARRE